MRIVLDANVVIAAFASRGLCESVLEFCLAGQELIFSPHLLDEIATNLRRKIKLSNPVVESVLELLRDQGTMFDPTPVPADACRDPDDTKILGLAMASEADYIVTGDKDLLVLKAYQGIPIVSPRSFSEKIRERRD